MKLGLKAFYERDVRPRSRAELTLLLIVVLAMVVGLPGLIWELAKCARDPACTIVPRNDDR